MSLLRQRLTLVGIALLFLAPLMVAVLMQSDWWDYRPQGMRNAGLLVQPPVPLPAHTLNDHQAGDSPAAHWTLLYQVNNNCDQGCRADLGQLRRVHLASGRHIDRIRVVVLRDTPFPPALSAELKAIYAEFRLLESVDTGPGSALRAANERALAANTKTRLNGSEPGWIHLIDPLGNVMLAYMPGQNPGDIRTDLKRLLEYSKMDGTS
jgi:hypothetical protein